MRGAVLVVALATAACSMSSTVDEMPLIGREHHRLERGDPVGFDVDHAFTESEREELAAAVETLRTEGFLVVLTTGGGEGRIIRGKPNFGPPLGPEAGGAYSHQLFAVWIVAEDPDMQRPGAIHAIAVDMLRGLAE